jgi:hypothetical protein
VVIGGGSVSVASAQERMGDAEWQRRVQEQWEFQADKRRELLEQAQQAREQAEQRRLWQEDINHDG